MSMEESQIMWSINPILLSTSRALLTQEIEGQSLLVNGRKLCQDVRDSQVDMARLDSGDAKIQGPKGAE